jgi:sterol 3beta-glucosyltransferase/vancomycin aglycone glucosyltransferase
LLVVHVMAFQATTAAEAAGRPFACVSFAPLFPTSNYPPIGAPRLGRLLNPALWWIVAKAMDGILRGRVARVRERAGLPEDRDAVARMLKRAKLGLLAMSPRLLPRATDWDERLHVPGFLEIHEDGAQAALTPELSAFLAAGPAPAFFSTGSMANLEPERAMTAARAMIEAARALGLRVVVQVPDAAREGLPGGPDVVVIARAPHALLFPRCAVLVHHGGAGTTHAALRAGRPSIIVPHIADQFFWGDLLHRRGVAGAPLPIGSLDSRSLGSRLRKVTENNAFQERAAALARELAVEDGATAACDLIERAAR